jgi:hypothetical protein
MHNLQYGGINDFRMSILFLHQQEQLTNSQGYLLI